MLLLVFACDLQLPRAIQIKGSPELKLTANWEFDIFSDMMENAFGGDDDLEIHECINAPEPKTFLIRMEIFDENVSLGSLSDEEDTITIGGSEVPIGAIGDTGVKYKLNQQADLASSDTPKKLPFSGFGDYLDGFKLKTEDNIKSKLYIDGAEIVTAITIELKLDGEVSKGKVSQKGLANNAHTLPKLPDGGIDVKIPENFFDNNNDGVNIEYKIYLAQNEEIEADWLDDEHPFNAELVIWIPLVLVAEKDDAEITFDSFEGIGDFFTSMSESGFIESLNIAVGMSANPFIGGTLVIKDPRYTITNPIGANALDFALGEKDVKYINNNPFDPEFSVIFKKDDELKIPKDFSITTVSITAKLNYTVGWGDM
jgi:hypothetical protein